MVELLVKASRQCFERKTIVRVFLSLFGFNVFIMGGVSLHFGLSSEEKRNSIVLVSVIGILLTVEVIYLLHRFTLRSYEVWDNALVLRRMCCLSNSIAYSSILSIETESVLKKQQTVSWIVVRHTKCLWPVEWKVSTKLYAESIEKLLPLLREAWGRATPIGSI